MRAYSSDPGSLLEAVPLKKAAPVISHFHQVLSLVSKKTHRVNFFVFTRMSTERFISFTYDLNLLFTRIFLSAGEQLYEVYCMVHVAIALTK